MKLKDYIEEDKPREKLNRLGISNLSDSELLCILLRTGNRKESVNELSIRILKECGNLEKLSEFSFYNLSKINGIKKSKAAIILTAFELGKRALNTKSEKCKMNNTKEIYEYFKNDFINEKQERFYVLLFDTKMNLIKKSELFKGTIDNVSIHPREIFKEAIKESASFIIVMHNHPSGDTTPSNEDIEITNRLISASNIIGIKFLDHIIISSEGYFSFYADSKKKINS